MNKQDIITGIKLGIENIVKYLEEIKKRIMNFLGKKIFLLSFFLISNESEQIIDFSILDNIDGMIVLTIIGILIFMIKTESWVRMTLGLILVFLNTFLLLLLFGLEFIGMIYLVVYIGAICVLLLFVLILLNLRNMDDMDDAIEEKLGKKGIIPMVFIYIILIITFKDKVKRSFSFSEKEEEEDYYKNLNKGHLDTLNDNIISSFVDYLLDNKYLFILLGLLLFVGILLPIMITKNITHVIYLKKQELVFSFFKSFRNTLLVKKNRLNE